MSLGSAYFEMSVTFVNSSTYVGFNSGSQIVEYSLTNTSFVSTKTYFPQSQTSFRHFIYTAGYNYMVVGTNNSQVQFYNCSLGNNKI